MTQAYFHGFMCGYLRKTANISVSGYNPMGPKPMTMHTNWEDLSPEEQQRLHQMQNQISPTGAQSITGAGWNQMDSGARQQLLGQVRMRQGSQQQSVVPGF